MTEPKGCRWCNQQEPEVQGFAIQPVVYSCKECGAGKHPTIGLKEPGGKQVKVWHNPDNSLFIEFEQASGKTSRYTLSEAFLLKAGLLQWSDTPFKGVK